MLLARAERGGQQSRSICRSGLARPVVEHLGWQAAPAILVWPLWSGSPAQLRSERRVKEFDEMLEKREVRSRGCGENGGCAARGARKRSQTEREAREAERKKQKEQRDKKTNYGAPSVAFCRTTRRGTTIDPRRTQTGLTISSRGRSRFTPNLGHLRAGDSSSPRQSRHRKRIFPSRTEDRFGCPS